MTTGPWDEQFGPTTKHSTPRSNHPKGDAHFARSQVAIDPIRHPATRIADFKRGRFSIVMVRVFGRFNNFCHYGIPGMADWQEKCVAEFVRQILKEN